MIFDLVPRVREALKVSSAYDADTIPAIIGDAIRFLLRGWDFPLTRTRWDSAAIPLAPATPSIALPAGFKKPYAVKLLVTQNNELLQKDLPRGAEDALPSAYGPQSYSIVGGTLYLDTPMYEPNYFIRLWYKSILLASAEPWITTDYADTVFVRSVYGGANELSKPEVLQAYSPLWQEQVMQLGQSLVEDDYSDSEVIMRPEHQNRPPRYGYPGWGW